MSELRELERHLLAATAILAKLLDEEPEAAGLEGGRDPTHFRPSGHLSDAGVEAIYALFDKGYSIEDAAKQMGISQRGAASRRQSWQNRKTWEALAD